jgi:sporulation protein YlmC with PRC-barrel domain
MAKSERDTTVHDAERTDLGDGAPREAATRDDAEVRGTREDAPVRDEATRLPSLSRLKGMDVRDADGEKVGTIDDLYLDPGAERVRYLSVSTGRLSRGTHVVPIDDVTYVEEGADDDAHAVVPYSTEHLKGAPSLDDDGAVTPAREREIRGYYDGVGRRDAERDALRARQRTPAPTPQIAEAELADATSADRARGDGPRR